MVFISEFEISLYIKKPLSRVMTYYVTENAHVLFFLNLCTFAWQHSVDPLKMPEEGNTEIWNRYNAFNMYLRHARWRSISRNEYHCLEIRIDQLKFIGCNISILLSVECVPKVYIFSIIDIKLNTLAITWVWLAFK